MTARTLTTHSGAMGPTERADLSDRAIRDRSSRSLPLNSLSLSRAHSAGSGLRRFPNASASLIQSGVFGSTFCDIARAVSRWATRVALAANQGCRYFWVTFGTRSAVISAPGLTEA
jgi:hypothetical protein